MEMSGGYTRTKTCYVQTKTDRVRKRHLTSAYKSLSVMRPVTGHDDPFHAFPLARLIRRIKLESLFKYESINTRLQEGPVSPTFVICFSTYHSRLQLTTNWVTSSDISFRNSTKLYRSQIKLCFACIFNAKVFKLTRFWNCNGGSKKVSHVRNLRTSSAVLWPVDQPLPISDVIEGNSFYQQKMPLEIHRKMIVYVFNHYYLCSIRLSHSSIILFNPEQHRKTSVIHTTLFQNFSSRTL